MERLIVAAKLVAVGALAISLMVVFLVLCCALTLVTKCTNAKERDNGSR